MQVDAVSRRQKTWQICKCMLSIRIGDIMDIGKQER